jgi:predicted ATPase
LISALQFQGRWSWHQLFGNCVITAVICLQAYPDADIYQFDESGISKIAYEDTDHFNITRNFLANSRRMLDILMSE